MNAFLAILNLMGIMHKPGFPMHWPRNTLISTPVFGQLISRDRFLLLLRFMHFADNRNYHPQVSVQLPQIALQKTKPHLNMSQSHR